MSKQVPDTGVNMTEEQVVNLMKSSKTEQEWNDNCDKVKDACGGYPDFWYGSIIMAGITYGQ